MDNNKQIDFQECMDAAMQGDPEAQYQLALCYETGDGVEADADKAFEWYKKAAEQGVVEAQNSLGCCYYNGEGTPQDYGKAAQWFKQAAQQNHSYAQYHYALCFLYGTGVTPNYEEARAWLIKAAEQGNSEAKQLLESQRKEKQRNIRKDGLKEIIIGAVVLSVGLIITLLTYRSVSDSGGRYIIAWGAMLSGAILMIKGVIDVL